MMEQTACKKIFGTDGVRGRANTYPMTVEIALALGRAAGKLFKIRDRKHKVVIGKDTRLSCYMFENALIAGLCSMGVDTLMVGPLPTPAVAFITRAYRAQAGIVISASHNPYADNGIKFFSSEGFKLSDDWERDMEEMIQNRDFLDCLPADDEIGRNFKVVDAHGRYIEFAKATFPKGKTLDGMKIVLDCANGSGYKVAPLIFEELDATVHAYGNQPNGLNINAGCGALHPESLQKKVLEHGADCGIALDGDGDRLIMVDERGRIIDGDVLLAICAKDMMQSGMLKNNRVVTTVMSNLGFIRSMESLGIEVVQTQVGDRQVIQEMLKCESNLGGEQSGHIILLDNNTTGDGIVAALQILRIMKEQGLKLSELSGIVDIYPQICLNVRVKSRVPLEELKSVQIAIDEVEKKLGEKGRVLVRYSGTETLCRVMVEGPDHGLINQFARDIAKVIELEIGDGEPFDKG